jgi:3-phosphoglycerate kinase
MVPQTAMMHSIVSNKQSWVLQAIAKKLADLSGKGVTTIVGAGFSVVGVVKKMSHLSTGGRASLELLQGKVLADVALDEAVATVAA